MGGTTAKGPALAYSAGFLSAGVARRGRFPPSAVMERRECITVDGEFISPIEYAYCMERVAAAAGEERPTSFEAETAAALLDFARKGCRGAVLEAGRGGRDDATNVSGSKAAVAITSIALDHTEFLGDTLEKITLAKAGIADSAGRVYSCLQEKESETAIKRYCAANGIECRFVPPLKPLGFCGGRQLASYCGGTLSLMPGISQLSNAALAAAVCEGLKERGFFLPESAFESGMAAGALPGRQELIDGKLLLDGAHNPAAARELAASVRACFPGVKKIALAGVFADKDYKGVLEATLKEMDAAVTFDWDNRRALGGKELQKYAEAFCKTRYIPDVEDALKEALAQAEGGIVVAYGSFSHLKLIKSAYGRLAQRSL